MNKYERPIRTGVYYQNCNTISIMGETEKAYFIIYSYDDRRGTSKKIDKVEVERWIPKSIWDNSKNFKEIIKTPLIKFSGVFLLSKTSL